MGGKSSSSSSTSSVQETHTNTSTGAVGDVIQGQQITITDNLPEDAAKIFNNMIALISKTVDAASAAGGKAIDVASEASKTAAQPDVALIQGYQKQIYYGIAAVAVVAVIMFLGKAK